MVALLPHDHASTPPSPSAFRTVLRWARYTPGADALKAEFYAVQDAISLLHSLLFTPHDAWTDIDFSPLFDVSPGH